MFTCVQQTTLPQALSEKLRSMQFKALKTSSTLNNRAEMIQMKLSRKRV